MSRTSRRDNGAAPAKVALGALGVVFGDIGTSPLYALRTIFEKSGSRPLVVDKTTVFGVVSTVVWSLIVVVTVLYVGLITRADNDGEGGLLALVALLRRQRLSHRVATTLFGLGILGAALFFGDSLITPAISVLSAVEGVQTIDPGFKHLVVPGAVLILFALIVIQRWGTGRVGVLFGPVMACWFVAGAVLGVAEVARSPQVLEALSPIWCVRFLMDDPLRAFLALGGIVLVITGAEALYADIGHFGRRPIALAWLVVVLPAIVLTYLGQAALLLRRPESVSDPFFELVPHWALIPMVVLATAATVIASQAVISGTFSVAQQAVRLGYLPRLRVLHTSESQPGQVYVPFVNGVLMVGVLALVVGFRSSSHLTSAYGLAVSGTITISTLLFFTLLWVSTAGRRALIGLAALGFLTTELTFVASNMVKIPTGGWLPVGIGVVFFVALTTWRRGSVMVERLQSDAETDLSEFVTSLREKKHPVERVWGCGVFLSHERGTTPLALRGNVEHNHALHHSTVVLTFTTESVAHIPRDEWLEIDAVERGDDGISQITARLGFFDDVSVPELLVAALGNGLEAEREDLDGASFFISEPELRVTDAAGMARWRKHLFVAMAALRSDPIEHFQLPRQQTVLLGSEVDI